MIFPWKRKSARLLGQHLARITNTSHMRLVELSKAIQLELNMSADLHDHGKPRLWLNESTNVVMEPDRKTYRLVQEQGRSWNHLFETEDPRQMLDILRHYGFNEPERSAATSAMPFNVGMLRQREWLALAALAVAVLLSAFLHYI